MIGIISRPGSIVDAIDFFCGYGGSAQGIKAAGADLKAAANHNRLAIECHAANYRETTHYIADLVDTDSSDYMDPADLPHARFAWFSPGCTHHSLANAKKIYQRGRQGLIFPEDDDFDEAAYANSERSRVTMSCVLRYAAKHKPEIIVTENVVEVTLWGPDRDGSTFAWWLRTLQKLGYETECLFLNSQFFAPCPQSRDRIYVVAWRKGNKRPDLDYRPLAFCVSQRCGGRHVSAVQTWKQRTRAWPLQKWGKYKRQYIYTCPVCRNAVEPAAWPAYTAINWKNLGPTLGERAELGMKPLATATIARTRRALAKFSGAPPVVIPAKAVWGTDKPVSEPFTVQTTQQDKALVSTTIMPDRANTSPTNPLENFPTMMTHSDLALTSTVLPAAGNTFENGDYTRARHVSSPFFTQHTSQAFGFASMPSIVQMRGGGCVQSGQHAVCDPTHTVTAGGHHHGLISTPLLLNGQDNDSVQTVVDPAFTVRANGGPARLITPALFSKINGSPTDTAWHPASDPFNTVTPRDTHGLIMLPWVDQFRADPVGVTKQLAALMVQVREQLDAIQEIPLDDITDEDLMRTHFRMLEPDPELRRAMAFADDYILLGNKTQITAGLGNSVTPPASAWITGQCLATLG